jgi:hypothetical protein
VQHPFCLSDRSSIQTSISPFNTLVMTNNSSKEVFILGLTSNGKPFRPSDWAERLAGVMSQFRPGGSRPGSHLGYSPWCAPSSIGAVKCVVLHHDLRDFDVLAWDFCINFAKDNDLQINSNGVLPDGIR